MNLPARPVSREKAGIFPGNPDLFSVFVTPGKIFVYIRLLWDCRSDGYVKYALVLDDPHVS